MSGLWRQRANGAIRGRVADDSLAVGPPPYLFGREYEPTKSVSVSDPERWPT